MNAIVRNLAARIEADIDAFYELEGVAGCSTVLAHDMLKIIEDMAATAVKRNRVIRGLRRRCEYRLHLCHKLAQEGLVNVAEGKLFKRANNDLRGG